MNKNKYDIFISYRREDGFDSANLLYNNLTSRGYKVFLDVNKMEAGPYDTQLYKRIDDATDVILIYSPLYLKRCNEVGDWVREEIVYAMKTQKKIIPFWLEGFSFPEEAELPLELKSLPKYQAVVVNKLLYEECVRKLCSYLSSKPFRKVFLKKLGIAFLITIFAISGGGIFLKQMKEKQNEEMQSIAQSQAASMDQYCLADIGYIHENTEAVLRVIDKSGKYMKANTNISDFTSYCNNQKDAIVEQSRIELPDVEETFQGVEYCKELHEEANQSLQYTGYIDFINWLLKESPYGSEEKKEIIMLLKEILLTRYSIALNTTYGAFFTVDNIFEKNASGEYSYSTIEYIYEITSGSMTAFVVNESLFGLGREQLSDEDIKRTLSNEHDACRNIATEIRNKYVGSKLDEYIKKEII